MSQAHPRSSMLVICVFFATASSVTVAVTTPMLKTTTSGNGCEWETDGRQDKNNQSCYLFISEPKSYYQANESCIEEGAHLVSIANKDENALVNNLTSSRVNDVWIGLHRPTDEVCAGSSCTTWMWLDGSGLEFGAWKDSIGDTTTQCVSMNPVGKWAHGVRCTGNLNFVCEKSIPPSTTPEPTTMAVTSEMTDFSVSNSATWGHVGSTPKNFGSDETNHFSIFMGVGVLVGVFIIAIIIGAVVCVMKRRQGRIVKTSKVIADRDASTDMGNYENVDMSVSSQSLVISEQAIPDGVYVNSFTIDSTVSTRNHEDDTTNRTAYEEVTNYAEISPEYTPLQFTDSTHTNENS